MQIGLERLEGGSDPEEEPGQQGDPEGVEEHRAVDGEFHPEGERVVGGDRDLDPADAPIGEGEPHEAAQQADQYALGEELPEQAQAAGAEGGAHRHLPLPHRGPREQEVRHVGAGDQEDADHRSQHREEDQVHLRAGGLLVQRPDVAAPARMGVRKLRRDPE